MKKRLQKLFAVLLTISLLMSLMSISAFATGEGADTGTDDGSSAASTEIIGRDGGYFEDIDFKLFNYAGDMNDDAQIDGVNSNGVADFFKFRGTHKENTAVAHAAMPMNSIWDDDGYTADRVKLQDALVNGSPVVDTFRAEELLAAFEVIKTADATIAAAQATLDNESATEEEKAVAQQTIENTTAAKEAAEELVDKYETDPKYSAYFKAHKDDCAELVIPEKVSLGFLFGAGGAGVTNHDPENTILQYDPATKTYSYNSAINAVDFDGTRFWVRDYTERTTTSNTSYDHDGNDFLPFNNIASGVRGGGTGKDGAYLYDSATEVDYWFGMTMEFDFWMPKDGMIGNDDMVFNFSGDDDVWVFIDDQLVMDLGGTHGTVTGTINFADGTVTQYLSWLGGSADNTEDTETTEATSFPTKFAIPAENEKHTLKFFYLERAVAVANCSMSFNLPVIPAGMVTVEKQVDGVAPAGYDTYEFILTKNDVPVANVPYFLNDLVNGDKNDAGEPYTTDGEGKFALRAGDKAFFTCFTSEDVDNDAKIKVTEISDLGFIRNPNETSDEFTLDIDGEDVVIINKMKTADFSFKKTDNKSGNPLQGAEFGLYVDGATTPIATRTSNSNGEVIFENIPFGTYTLKEISAPGTHEATTDSWPVVVSYDSVAKAPKVTLNGYGTDEHGKIVMVSNVEVEGTVTEQEVPFTIANKALNSLTIEKTVVIDTSAYDASVGNAKAPRELSFDTNSFEFTVKNSAGAAVAENVKLSSLAKVTEECTDTRTVWRGTATVNGLPADSYTVVESKHPALANTDYAWTVDYDNDPATTEEHTIAINLDDGATGKADVVNTYTHIPNCFRVEVEKAWEDDSDRDGLRPDSLTVGLFIGTADTPIETAVLNAANEWKYTFKYDCVENQGDRTVREIAYTIGETTTELAVGENVPGYTLKDRDPSVVENGRNKAEVTLTNEHTPELMEVAVRKVWADSALGREQEVTVYLHANGVKTDKEAKLNAENNWYHVFENLHVNENGKPIEYTISEKDLGSRWSYGSDKTEKDYFVNLFKHTEESAIAAKKAELGEAAWIAMSAEDQQAVIGEKTGVEADEAVAAKKIELGEAAWSVMTVEDQMAAVAELTSQYVIDVTVFDGVEQFVVVTNAYSSGYTPPPPPVITPDPEPEPEPIVIPDDDVPLAVLPEEDVPLAILPEEEVPLALLPATGDASALWMALSALSGAGLFLTRKKRDEE